MAKRIQVGGRIESKEVGGIVTGAAEILDDAKEKKQSVINQETDDELARLDQSKQDNLTFDNAPTEGSDNPVKSGGVYAADKALSDAIEAILLLIPSAASALNKLVDTDMMNSSISTATATFRGTYNVVTDLSLTVDATHEQIAAALGNAISTADNNDYAFVQIPVSAESTDIRRTERYKFNGTVWGFEYDLNTSGFTAAQWAAINSGITLALVGKLIGLPTSSELQALLGQKQDTLTFDNVPTAGSANPVKSGGAYSAINDEKTAREELALTVTGINGRVGNVEEVIPTGAAANNKLVANNSMEAYVTSIIEAITASFTIATADGHINLTLTQTNGRVASLTLTSSDIASAQALTALMGRVSTAESNITTLSGRVSTNETDIANLQQLYNDLQQSKPVPVTALPETGQQQGVIYRLAGTTSYSDYMWNGSTWVLMATYNNAIDDVPIAGSNNLVKSGGVYVLANNEKKYITRQIDNLKFLRELYIENATEDLYIILFGKQNGVRMLQIAGSSTIYCTIYDASAKSGYYKFVKNGTIIHLIVDYDNMPGQSYYPSYNKDDNVKLLDAAYNKIYSPTIQQKLKDEEIEGDVTLLSKNKADLIVGKNLFDKNAIIERKYISTGGTLNTADNCAVSEIIPVVGGKTYYLYRGHNKIDASTARFLDADGRSLAPLDINGDAYPDYSPGESNVVKAPSNAIGFQFTCKFNGSGDINITQFETGSEYTGYEEYKKTVPESQLPNINVDTDSPLKGKLIAYNGDSICESRFSGSMANGGSYPAIIADIVDGDYNNRAISGGILASQTGDGTTPARFVCLDVENMPADADLICFEGGINDYYTNVPLGDFSPSDYSGAVDTTTVCGALESIFRQAINRWPGKRIVFIIIHKVRHTAFSVNSAGYTFGQLHDKVVDVCEKYSIPYYDCFKDGGLNTYFDILENTYTLHPSGSEYGDMLHPTEDGYRKYYVPQLIDLFTSLIERG